MQEDIDSSEEFQRVKLKTVFSIHPFIFFVIKVLLLLLAICIIPSFFTTSRRLYVNSSVFPLRVIVDGKDAGMTPCNLRVSSGVHDVDFYYADEKVSSYTVNVLPAWFLSYIFEYSSKLNADILLTQEIKEKIHCNFLQDCIDYQTLFNVDSTHTFKPFFNYYKGLLGEEVDSDCVQAARYFVTSRVAADDYNQNFSYLHSFDFSYIRDGEFLLSAEENRDIEKINRFGEKAIAGREFIEFDDFFVSKDLVDIALFDLFLKENTKFAKSNKKNLVENNIADDYYLFSFGEGSYVRCVSYNVICEFVKWFSSKYSCNARLLSKYEYLQLYEYKSYFKNFVDGLFEVTSTSFIPYEAISGKRLDKDVRDKICKVFEEHGVKMSKEIFCLGDYNRKTNDSRRLKYIGVINQESCYETVGFRIAIDK